MSALITYLHNIITLYAVILFFFSFKTFYCAGDGWYDCSGAVVANLLSRKSRNFKVFEEPQNIFLANNK